MGDGIAELGRWLALMSILYDVGGLYDITAPAKKRYLMRELELKTEDDLNQFLANCAECDLLSADLLKLGHVVCHGVTEQLEYYKAKSEAGKKGMAKRWGKAEKNANSTC